MEQITTGQDEQRLEEQLRELWIQAAYERTNGLQTEVRIGNTPIPEGATYEQARKVFHALVGEGALKLTFDYKPTLTDEGRKEHFSHLPEPLF